MFKGPQESNPRTDSRDHLAFTAHQEELRRQSVELAIKLDVGCRSALDYAKQIFNFIKTGEVK